MSCSVPTLNRSSRQKNLASDYPLPPVVKQILHGFFKRYLRFPASMRAKFCSIRNLQISIKRPQAGQFGFDANAVAAGRDGNQVTEHIFYGAGSRFSKSVSDFPPLFTSIFQRWWQEFNPGMMTTFPELSTILCRLDIPICIFVCFMLFDRYCINPLKPRFNGFLFEAVCYGRPIKIVNRTRLLRDAINPPSFDKLINRNERIGIEADCPIARGASTV